MILPCPVGVLRHLEFFFDLVQRFSLRRHFADALDQQIIKCFVFVEDIFVVVTAPWPGTTISGLSDFISL